jgi:hypothetical protein
LKGFVSDLYENGTPKVHQAFRLLMHKRSNRSKLMRPAIAIVCPSGNQIQTTTSVSFFQAK